MVGSLSKSLRMSGWRIGYVVAPEAMTAAGRLVHERTTVGAARPLQEGIAAWAGDDAVAGSQRRRDHLVSALSGLGLGVVAPEGGWFALVDTAPLGYRSDEFAAELLAATGVLVTTGSAFFTDHHAPTLVRTTFVRGADRTAVALDRIGGSSTPGEPEGVRDEGSRSPRPCGAADLGGGVRVRALASSYKSGTGGWRTTVRGERLFGEVAESLLGYYVDAYGPVLHRMGDLLDGSTRYDVDVRRDTEQLGLPCEVLFRSFGADLVRNLAAEHGARSVGIRAAGPAGCSSTSCGRTRS